MKKQIIYIFIVTLYISVDNSVTLAIKEKNLAKNDFLSKFNNLKGNPEKQDKFGKKQFYEICSSTGTIFIAGFGDKSFLITTVMATKYPKMTVFISALTSLTLMGYISVQVGLKLPNYIPTYWIDICAVLVFLIIGLKMTIDGLKMSSKLEENKLFEVQKEINKEIFRENENIVENEKLENSSDESKKKLKESFSVFIQTFSLIFLSELGDKSQISTIYLSANSDPMIIFYSVTIAQFVLTLIAILGGKLIAGKISERTLTIIAGAMFLTFGLISLYLTYINDYVIINKAWHKFISKYSNPHPMKIPDKTLLTNSLMKV